MSAKIPNLELTEYKFRQYLYNDKEWALLAEKEKEENRYWQPEINLYLFPQTWGSTCTAFDMDDNGNSVMGGCAMTKAYTIVAHEIKTEYYAVFIEEEPCYMVKNPTQQFYDDLKAGEMKGKREALKVY